MSASSSRRSAAGAGGAVEPLPLRLFVLAVDLPPKKNSMEVRRTGRPCQACGQPTGRTFVGHEQRKTSAWDAAVLLARAAWKGPPIKRPVVVRARYFRMRLDADPTNLDSALADVLEAAGVVENDRLLCVWADAPIKDARRPRVEFWFVEAGADVWAVPAA